MADETNATPTLTSFTAGDLVVSISGDGDGSGTYTDNQAAPITLQELTTSGTVVGQLVLPQTTTVVNGTTEYAISGEYGSSSEGLLELSADGQSLTIGGYGVNANTYNSGGAAVYGDARLAQSTSLTSGTSYTPVARVVADISYNGKVDTSTALYNIFNTNNIRSVATVNGTSFYVAGQGVKGDTTQGVFYAKDGASSTTAIDTSTDARDVEIVNGELYVSRDSKQGPSANLGSYGTTLPVTATTAQVVPGISNSVTLTSGETNSLNASAVGTTVNLSPEQYFFANATTLYVADGGSPKAGGVGDGGLQKWTYNGSSWVLDYTLSQGLNLVSNTATSGSTGLIGLTGVVSGGTVTLYTTNSTIGDTDQTYLYGIADTLSVTTAPASESFTVLETAAPDTNIRGVSFAPTAAATTPTNTVVSSGTMQAGLTVTSGSTVTVLSSGTLASSTILSGGVSVVSSGGVDIGSTIANGATETVLGSANGETIEGTQIVSAATATVSNETVYNGGVVDLFLKGATATGLTLTNGGRLNISGNATAINTVISSGGLIDLQSPKAVLSGSVTFNGSGSIDVETTISAGYGDFAVISGFGAGDAVDLITVGSGALLTTANSGGNTVATVTSGSVSQSFIFAGAVGSSLMLTSDGTGGEKIVQGAAVTSNTVVSSGATSSGLTITSGNSLTVNSGGTVVGTTLLSGAIATINGQDTNALIAAGATETVLGAATGDAVSGTQIVSAATATVSNETVYNGGAIDLFLKGAVATGLTISSGGALNISGNATAIDTTLASGGLIDLQSPKGVLSGGLTFQGPATLREDAVISAGYGALGLISGFVAGDVIDLVGFGSGATLATSASGANTVATVSSGGLTESFTLVGATASALSLVSDGGNGVAITTTQTACFAEGTLIETPDGACTVETLAAGDVVTTTAGDREVVWTGHREVDIAKVRDAESAFLVRIRRDAFAPGLPQRDLLVTQDHCVFTDGVLIPARMLVNGRSIALDRTIARYRYFHVELAQHAIIFAEGLPTESYLDTGNRDVFANVAVTGLFAAPSLNATASAWADAAAPLAVERAVVEPVWTRLDARAGELGFAPRAEGVQPASQETLSVTTACGRVLKAIRVDGNELTFVVPPQVTGLRLRSVAQSPAVAIGPFVDDRRQLGVKVAALTHRPVHGSDAQAHDLLASGAAQGWWPQDVDGRWTDGDAHVRLPRSHGRALLKITVAAHGVARETLRRAG